MTPASIPMDGWTIDMGESVVRLSHEEAQRIRPQLESLSARVIVVTDIFGSETWVMRDKILHVGHHSLEIAASARKYLRDYTAALDTLDPDGATTKDWEK